MENNLKLVLQYRWKLIEIDCNPHFLYYGVRNVPYQQDNLVMISKDLANRMDLDECIIISQAKDPLSSEIEKLSSQGILTPPEQKIIPKTQEKMQVCTNCVTNDFVIPGLEFDNNGVCALCQCYALDRKSVQSPFMTITEDELKETAAKNIDSRFDVMLFYTGGKDSSYLLWLLARKLGLKVLAAFWNMPYCSEAAYANIIKAKKHMKEVEFVEWILPLEKVQDAMLKKWKAHGWPCLCPTAAFPVLYPLAFNLRIPYVFLGLEDIQTSVLDYVFSKSSVYNAQPPSPRMQTLKFLSARSLPRKQVTPTKWWDEMMNYHASVRNSMPDIFKDLTSLVDQASKDPRISLPLISRLSTNMTYGKWDDVQSLLENEMDWHAPEGQNNLLHTSCKIEVVKDYLQFQRFKLMRTVFMPQSLVELGAAVYFGLAERKNALSCLKELGYFQIPEVLHELINDLGISKQMVQESDDELQYSLSEWASVK